jgi:hypothetical protein
MSEHAATPNSNCDEKVSPASKNDKASFEGTRYGKNGNSPAGGDASRERIVTSA